MIMLGVDGAFVKGEVRSRDRDFTLEARLNRGPGASCGPTGCG